MNSASVDFAPAPIFFATLASVSALPSTPPRAKPSIPIFCAAEAMSAVARPLYAGLVGITYSGWRGASSPTIAIGRFTTPPRASSCTAPALLRAPPWASGVNLYLMSTPGILLTTEMILLTNPPMAFTTPLKAF